MTKLHEFIVGAVFFFAMGVLGYYTIIRGEFFDRREFYFSTVIFEDVEGLSLGNKVIVNGVDSGTVSGIELRTDSRVRVTLKMYRTFTLYENYRILLKNQTALGGKNIAIYPGYAEFEGKIFNPVESMDNLTGKTIADPLTLISQVIDENRGDLNSAIKNLSQFSEKINRGNGTIAKLVNEDSIHKETGDLIKDLRDTVEDSREQAPVTSFIRAMLTAF